MFVKLCVQELNVMSFFFVETKAENNLLIFVKIKYIYFMLQLNENLIALQINDQILSMVFLV